MSEALIESRQFIGWWRNAVSDAITSSAYTGKRAIHSSDFSAFTKRSHCPSLLQFSGPKLIPTIIHLHFGDCLSGTLFSLRWSAMEVSPLSWPTAVRGDSSFSKDPHSKCIKCLGFSHGTWRGLWDLQMQNLREFLSHNPPLLALGLWEWIFHLSPSRPRGFRGLSVRSRLHLGFGCWARGDGEWADRPRLFSPSLSGACSREFNRWGRLLPPLGFT